MIKGVCTGSEADNQTRRLRHCHSNQPAPLNGTPLSQYQPGSSAMTKEHVSGSEAGAPALEAGTCDNRNTRLYPIIVKQIGKNHGNSQNHYTSLVLSSIWQTDPSCSSCSLPYNLYRLL